MNTNIRTNVIVNLIRTLALTILSFMTFPWVCRVLGDAQLGLYTWCNTFVYYFLVLAKIGLPNLALRECVKVRDNKELLSNKAQGFFILQSVTTILSFGLMCSFVFAIPSLFDAKSIIFLLSINFISGAFSFEWIFMALEKQFYISVRSIIVLALSAIMIITLVKNPDDVYIYALITASVTVITSIVNFAYVTKYISFKKTMPYDLKQYARPLFTLCTLSFMLALYNQTDTLILGFINNDKSQVGSYSVGIKGIEIIIGIITSLSTVFIPRATFYYGKEDKRFFKNLFRYSVNICSFIVIPAIIMMCFLSKEICIIIAGNEGYSNAALILIVLSCMMLTYSLGDIIYGQILIPMKKEKYYLYAMLAGVILNVSLSFLLGLVVFKNNPAVGVAIGTIVTDVIVLVFLVAISYKWVYKGIFSLNNLKILLGGLIISVPSILFTIVFPIGNLFPTLDFITKNVVQLFLVAGIDIIIYIISLIIMKEDLVYSFIKKSPKEI